MHQFLPEFVVGPHIAERQAEAVRSRRAKAPRRRRRDAQTSTALASAIPANISALALGIRRSPSLRSISMSPKVMR